MRENQSDERTLSPVDNESVRRPRGNQSTESTTRYDVSAYYDTANNLTDVAFITGDCSQNDKHNEVLTIGHTNEHDTVNEMSAMMSDVTNVLKDALKELRDLWQSALH